jgi:pilus assembly protein CpaF
MKDAHSVARELRPISVLVRAREGPVQRIRCAPKPEIVIGRDATSDIVLRSPEVSRRHLLLSWEGERIRGTDVSANGTGANDRIFHRASEIFDVGASFMVGPFVVQVEPRQESAGLDDEDLGAGPDRARAPVTAAVLTAVPMSAQAAEPAAEVSATAPHNTRGTSDVAAATRREIHRQLLDHLDLAKLERGRMNPRLLRSKVRLSLEGIIASMHQVLPAGTDAAALVTELTNEALGLGPLEELLADAEITEIMVVDPRVIYVERGGKLELTDRRFTDDESVRSVLERIVTPLGRRIDESSPMLDARLADGSRVNAVIAPLAIRGTCITIRKFPLRRWGRDDLLRFGTLDAPMARFLERCVATRKNILVSGGTGSGKTTLLNILSTSISPGERIVTIEDSAELRLNQPHVVPLEARPANMEGRGSVSIRDLVKNAMRMRPDRILVGECRGGEALDMLQAMNTGHDGSMTTTHANSPFEALKRIETLVLMAGLDLPSRAIREQIAASIDILVQQTRLPDGSRKVVSIAEVTGLDDDGELTVREIFGYRRERIEQDGTVVGHFYTTGYLPTFIADFIVQGLVPAQGGAYL